VHRVEADLTRDWLLDRARAIVADAERRRVAPEDVGGWLRATWPPGLRRDDDFVAVGDTGAEALAFVVLGDGGSRAAGLVLRLPEAYPDSFVAVTLTAGSEPPKRVDVMRSFLGRG
jgi:hypothetical protein